MTSVAILSVPTGNGAFSYRALSGEKHSQGRTPGEALDALTTQLSDEETTTLVIVQNFRPDRFFDAAQQRRLAELMFRLRQARDQGASLPAHEQAELDALVETEILASAQRAAAMADEAGR